MDGPTRRPVPTTAAAPIRIEGRARVWHAGGGEVVRMERSGEQGWNCADARAALTRLVARRRRPQTRFGIALYVERLIARKTCPACWRTTGFGMQARDLDQPVAHAIGCEAIAAFTTGGRVRHRADPMLTVLLRAARG
jgi:hypothetical protein